MFRGFHHAGRMLRLRRKTDAQDGAPGSHSAPVAWSTLLMGGGGILCFAAFLLPAENALLLAGAPLLLRGVALAAIEAILQMR